MSCGCRKSDEIGHHEAQRQADDLLERAGLREIVAQGRSAIDEGSRALGHLARAERAKVIGFGDDVVRMHRDAAVRCNRRARDQLGFVIQRMEDRRQKDDWSGIVEEAQAGFQEHGGRDGIEDAREEFRRLLLDEEPGLSAALCEQTLMLFDVTAERAGRGDLNAVVDLMLEAAEFGRDGFASEEMGRQPAPQVRAMFRGGPPTIAGGQDVNGWCVVAAACMVWAQASLFASIVICFAVPFCWCCFLPVLLIAFAAHFATCTAILAAGCK